MNFRARIVRWLLPEIEWQLKILEHKQRGVGRRELSDEELAASHETAARWGCDESPFPKPTMVERDSGL